MPAGVPVLFTRSTASAWRVALLATLAVAGCNLDNPGDDPPAGLLYFPNAITLTQHDADEKPRYLLIANSNFDLRYKHGTVQAMSLDRVARAIDKCTDEATCQLDPKSVIEDEVFIDPFSTSLAISPDGRQVFAPTRTATSLQYIGLDASANGDDVLSCGEAGRNCGWRAERGESELEAGSLIDWPPDPVAVISGRLRDIASTDPNVTGDAADNSDIPGNYVIVAHRGGSASLFIPTSGSGENTKWLMREALGGFPAQITELAFDPVSKLVHFTILNGGNSKLLARAGVIVPRNSDGTPDVEDTLLYAQSSLSLEAVDGFGDTRDLTFVPALPAAGAAFAGPRALVVSRSPSALLVVDVKQETSDNATSGELPGRGRVERTVVVGAGASRIKTGVIGGREIAVVSCFDSRELFVIDLETMLTRGVVPNLSGPFEVALDEARQLVYLADFRSSVIRVIDVSPVSAGVSDKPVRVIATIGVPRVLQELK